jgi:hypothetical protein
VVTTPFTPSMRIPADPSPNCSGESLMRPFMMLFTQPTIQLTGLDRAYLYGLMFFV